MGPLNRDPGANKKTAERVGNGGWRAGSLKKKLTTVGPSGALTGTLLLSLLVYASRNIIH